MATFQKRLPVPKPPPPDTTVDLTALAETITAPAQIPSSAQASAAARAPVEETARRLKGRPPSPEARVVFGTRLKAETIEDVEALKVGLRLKMQGEAIERAVALYKTHIIAKVRAELRLSPEIDDEAALQKAYKIDD